MSYEFVRYTPALKAQVAHLQTYLWSPDPALNTAYLEWKHERNPYVDEPLIYLATCEGRVVGMRGIFGGRWEIGHERSPVPAACAGDMVIAPKHRSQGLARPLMRFALEDLAARGYEYVFNLSASPTTHLDSLAMGWRGIGPLEIMQRQNGTTRRSPDAVSPERPFDEFDDRAKDSGGPVLVERAPRPGAMAALVERIGCDGRLRRARDEVYFAWRFQNPRAEYRFLFHESDPLDGYLVLHVSNDPARASRAGVTIVDWQATTAVVRASLLHAAVEWGRFGRLAIWSGTLPTDTRALLEDAGFAPRQPSGVLGSSRPTVLVRSVRNGQPPAEWVVAGRRLLDRKTWNLQLLDSDGQ